jgi:hypothetical protein
MRIGKFILFYMHICIDKVAGKFDWNVVWNLGKTQPKT